jgi:hypothetical protein
MGQNIRGLPSAITLRASAPLGIQAHHKRDCPIHSTQLVETKQAIRLTKSAGIHGSQLLDQYAGTPASDLNFGSERSGLCSGRGGCDDYRGQSEQFICLDYHSEASPSLLVTTRVLRSS